MAEAPKIPHFMRERLRAQQAGLRSAAEHPDADLLAAFSENSLARGQRSSVMNHLAGCEACREVVMFSQAAGETAQPVRLPAPPFLGWMTLRWASLAVVFVLTIGVVLMNRGSWQQPSGPAPSASKVAPKAPDLVVAPGGNDERKQFESDKPAVSAKSEIASLPRAREKSLEQRFNRPAGYAALQENRIGTSSAGKAQETKSAGLAGRAALAKREDSYRTNSGSGNVTVVQVESPAAVVPSVGTVSGAGLGAGTVQKSKSAAPPVAKGQTRGAELSASGTPSETTAVTAARRENFFYDGLDEQEPSKKKTAPEETPPAAAQPGSRQPVLARDDKNAVAQSLSGTPAANFEFEAKDQGEGLTISKEKLATAGPTPMKWRIRAGKLQQSTDDGETWQEVNLEPGVNLHSFWVQGASVWAGGTGGSLFHVSEQGKNAVRIPIKISGGSDVSQTVVTVTFSDELHGIITLENGQILRTADGGKTWERP
jgi:hypothetical protein